MKAQSDTPEGGKRRTGGKPAAGPWRQFRLRIADWPGQHPLFARILVLLAVFVSALTVFPERQESYQARNYRVGTIQSKAVIAEFDFDIKKDPDILRQEQELAEIAVPPVLVEQDSVKIAAFDALSRLEQTLSRLRRHRLPQDEASPEDQSIALTPATYQVLMTMEAADIFTAARNTLEEYYRAGLVTEDLEQRFRNIDRATLLTGGADWVGPTHRFFGPGRIDRALNELAGRIAHGGAVTELCRRFAWPNVQFNEQDTRNRQQLARDGVEQTIGRVLKGEKIVGAHERITTDILRKLESYEYWRPLKQTHLALSEQLRGIAGRVLLLILLLTGMSIYLFAYQRAVIKEFSDLLLLSITSIGFLLLAGLMLNGLHLSPYLIPVAGFAVMTSLLYNERLSLVASCFLTFMIGLLSDQGLTFLIVIGFGSIVAILSVRQLRDRRQYYSVLLYVPLVHLVALAAMGMTSAMAFDEMLVDAFWLVSNVFFTAGFGLFAVPLSESIFGKCTNLTLLELLDLNRPLLRRLMLEAPGTYHHSLMVGTLAEAGASAINANPLMARVQGYYHDIGKISKPEYFTENQMAGSKNPHDKLAPTMSRLILESHVRDGLAMAKENRLPKVVRDGIAQHHGTGVMSYFFHRAMKKDPQTPETEYRYPGPRPRSRELAIVLLADQIDAASRSLEEPTPSRLRGLVKQLLEKRAQEGELDESHLTLKDLAALRDAFIPILTALFHGRISYPKTEMSRGKTQTGNISESSAKAEG
jgi:cyclic-di-AMP phosphodiesterase PgpH